MEYKKMPAQLYVVRAYCDCGKELKYTGTGFMSNPALYEHECSACGIRYILHRCYPATEVEEIDTSKEVLD